MVAAAKRHMSDGYDELHSKRPRSEDSQVDLLVARWRGKNLGDIENVDELVSATHAMLWSEASAVREAVEYSQYLEVVAWPLFCQACKAGEGDFKTDLVLSVLAMVNEKARVGATELAWALLLREEGDEEGTAAVPSSSVVKKKKKKIKSGAFARFFQAVLELDGLGWMQREARVSFLIACFQSLEHAAIRSLSLRLTSLALWRGLRPARREAELAKYPQLARHWEQSQRRSNKASSSSSKAESDFLPGIAVDLLETVDSSDRAGSMRWSYACRCVELFTDLMSQLPTRRFLRLLLTEMRFYERLKLSAMYVDPDFRRLVDFFGSFYRFQINEQTGVELSMREVQVKQQADFHALQRACFETFGRSTTLHSEWAENLTFSGSASSTREELERVLEAASDKEVSQLALAVGAVSEHDAVVFENARLMRAVIVEEYSSSSGASRLDLEPLLPTERMLWQDVAADGRPMALPKLNLQFLSLGDYLWRSLVLYRLESTYQIRRDIVDAVKRLDPRPKAPHITAFGGSSRRARTTTRPPSITRIDKARLGQMVPAVVECECEIDLSGLDTTTVAEWDSLRETDVVFLVAIDANKATYEVSSLPDEDDCNFPKRFGVEAVRCGWVAAINGLPLDGDDHSSATSRVLTVRLEPAQYVLDEAALYGTVNVVVRRDPKVNTFRAVLETVRDLIREADTGLLCMPGWLGDAILGYGDPLAAHYSRLGEDLNMVYFDTFLDAAHIESSLSPVPENGVTFASDESKPPYRLVDPSAGIVAAAESSKEMGYASCFRSAALDNGLSRLFGETRKNSVRFTPSQVEAIRDGVNLGLARICGPPGTGKTDVAVQIAAELFRNFPTERTLIVAHSNAALNDLFAKIVDRDVDPRYLVRLGSGAADLDLDAAGDGFARLGRVEANLDRRLFLLDQVQRLASCLGAQQDAGYSCETAHYFDLAVVQPALAVLHRALDRATSTDEVHAAAAPLIHFFEADSETMFAEAATATDAAAVVRAAARGVRRLLDELDSYRAFELLRSRKQRADYMLTNQARIVALTCTHAALARRELLEIGFDYETVIFEEAAQILDLETFIPLVLQPSPGNIKRLVLIGDDRQLPPVVSHRGLERCAHFDQSLFARLGRLGAKSVHLDAQGRARPSICDLFRWRYVPELTDLDICRAGPYTIANPGFVFEYQFVDVEDGRESQPVPHFYQNLQEAEYLVSVYQYMRLLGYPAATISILAAYNGQKMLIRDVLRSRCEANPAFGLPAALATLDKYQGQQNDYVLLSLTRTKRLGHLRDQRRIVVALSRARLGLYVFGFKRLFQESPNDRSFEILFRRPTQLSLAFGDPDYSPYFARRLLEPPPTAQAIANAAEMRLLVDSLTARRSARESVSHLVRPTTDPAREQEEIEHDAASRHFIGPQLPPPGTTEI